MPSFETARRIASTRNNGAKTLGQIYKEDSDFVMETTWENDVQSKVCYIYDYYHDDKPWLAEDITHENTTKTKIDAKFIVTKYSSIDKDQVEYHLQFRPSQPLKFNEDDELYYFETDYRQKYKCDPFIGKYIDIPDDTGTYNKWMIVSKEIANQFVKFSVLPCNYELMWVELEGQNRIKRRMWSVLRIQNSYTIGVYTDRHFTRMDNQSKIWLPLNPISAKIWYTDNEDKNMRVIVSALTEHPIVWKITKVENVQPIGLQKLTIYQDFFNEHTDYVNLETGEMYADFYDSVIKPTEPNEPIIKDIYAKITASNSTLKVGGSYKTLTVNIFNALTEDVTDKYSNATFNWSCTIDNEDFTSNNVVTWLDSTSFNKKKLKFSNNRDYLEKILKVECEIVNDTETIHAIMDFELIV